MSTKFEARYPGRCNAGCAHLIEPGDQVTYDDEGFLTHADCQTPMQRPVVVCGLCWLTKPCECDT